MRSFDSYSEAVRKLVASGHIAEAEAEHAIAENMRSDAALDALKCPACDGPMTRAMDGRQAGETQVAGKWFNYRCIAKCGGNGYMTDRCEPVGEN